MGDTGDMFSDIFGGGPEGPEISTERIRDQMRRPLRLSSSAFENLESIERARQSSQSRRRSRQSFISAPGVSTLAMQFESGPRKTKVGGFERSPSAPFPISTGIAIPLI